MVKNGSLWVPGDRKEKKRLCDLFDYYLKVKEISHINFLLQCVKVKSESEVTQTCPTLSDSIDCSLPGSFIHGIFQARVLEWLPLPFPTVIATDKK